MMEGPHLRISLVKLYQALRGRGKKELEALVKESMEDLASRYQTTYELLAPLTDEVIEKIMDEKQKFSPRLPHPPAHANNMSIQIEMPTRGKVGHVEFNARVEV